MQKVNLLKLKLLLILGLVFFLFAVWYTYPKQVTRTLEGVYFEVGEERSKEIDKATVFVDGKLKRNFNGTKSFSGTFQVENLEMLDTTDSYLELNFGKEGWTTAIFEYKDEDGYIHTNSFITISINKYFSEVAFTISNENSWNSNDGKLYAAPAKSREVAINVANRLMKGFLVGKELES